MTPEQAATLYNGLIVFAGGVLLWLGTMLSRKAKANPPAPAAGAQVELAGAVINGKDARMLADAFDRMAGSAASLQSELVEHRRALDRNTRTAHEVSEATDHVNSEMRNLANAMLISRK